MHPLARGAARASGLCHHLSIFDAWEIVYLVLRSPEGARLRAISTRASKPPHRQAGRTDCRPKFTRSYMGQIRCISVEKRACRHQTELSASVKCEIVGLRI
jgi:hypothetical protein